MYDISQHDSQFCYQLLARLQMDCQYYLGWGNRQVKHLWAKNIKEQIKLMKALYNSFELDKKPEWLSMEEILDYEKRMMYAETNNNYLPEL